MSTSEVFWTPGMRLEMLEELVIKKAYRFYNKNKTATANSLGISIRTLDNKLEKYEMQEIEEAAAHDTRQRDRETQLARARGQFTNQWDTGSTPRPEQYKSHQAETGLRVESIANATEKSPVPVQVRPEVQEVLPGQATRGRPRKHG